MTHRFAAAVLLTAALSASSAATEMPCPQTSGAATLLRPGAIILLGELHGTTEAPRMVANLACEVVAAGYDVVVALELPQSDQPQLAVFMSGADPDDDRRQLLTGAFWQRDYQDGRTSIAMLDLHSRLRALAASSHRLGAVYIDDPSALGNRDRVMAQRILAVRAEAPDSVIIVLTGNLHNRLTRGSRWNPDHEPMGLFVARQVPPSAITSLELTYGPGSAWICQGSLAADCGATELSGRSAAGDGIVLLEADVAGAVSGTLHLGPITASPPAKLGPAPGVGSGASAESYSD